MVPTICGSLGHCRCNFERFGASAGRVVIVYGIIYMVCRDGLPYSYTPYSPVGGGFRTAFREPTISTDLGVFRGFLRIAMFKFNERSSKRSL